MKLTKLLYRSMSTTKTIVPDNKVGGGSRELYEHVVNNMNSISQLKLRLREETQERFPHMC